MQQQFLLIGCAAGRRHHIWEQSPGKPGRFFCCSVLGFFVISLPAVYPVYLECPDKFCAGVFNMDMIYAACTTIAAILLAPPWLGGRDGVNMLGIWFLQSKILLPEYTNIRKNTAFREEN